MLPHAQVLTRLSHVLGNYIKSVSEQVGLIDVIEVSYSFLGFAFLSDKRAFLPGCLDFPSSNLAIVPNRASYAL